MSRFIGAAPHEPDLRPHDLDPRDLDPRDLDPRDPAPRGRQLLARRQPAERAAYLTGALLIAVGLAHLIVALRYPRPWLGPLSWRKPVSFGVSFGLVLISVTWVAGYLRLPPRRRALVLGAFAADCVLEVTGITIQAWRDVPSHFNTESGFDSVIAFGLAAGGAVLVVTLGTLAGYALTGRVDAPPAMRLAVRAGFAFLLAGLAAGAAMIARGEQLIRGEHRLQAAYDTAGYLKWFHAITLHAVLVLPALAWLLARTRRTPEAQYRVVTAATGAYAVTAAAALVICVWRA